MAARFVGRAHSPLGRPADIQQRCRYRLLVLVSALEHMRCSQCAVNRKSLSKIAEVQRVYSSLKTRPAQCSGLLLFL